MVVSGGECLQAIMGSGRGIGGWWCVVVRGGEWC